LYSEFIVKIAPGKMFLIEKDAVKLLLGGSSRRQYII
jgi:hypothetical protein